MKQYEFEKRLDKQPTPKAVLLCGDQFMSQFLSEKYLRLLPNDIETTKLFYDEFSPETAIGHLSQTGLFSSTILLIIKTDKKIDNKTLNALIEIAYKNGDIYLLICFRSVLSYLCRRLLRSK